MKTTKNTKNHLRIIMLPLLAFMLVLSTVMPSVALAAGTGTDIVVEPTIIVGNDNPGVITAEKIEGTDTIKVVLKLTSGQEWAHDLSPTNVTKGNLIRDSMIADIDGGEWDKVKAGITFSVDSTKKELTMTFPVPPPSLTYNISKDQTITMHLSPALIENWHGSVAPITFKIHAKPQMSMSGSIMDGTTVSDLQAGGKEIKLTLVNAEWDTAQIGTLSGLSTLLNGFGGWEVAEAIKNVDPNTVVLPLTDANRTLTLKLPPVPTASLDGTITFTTANVAGLIIDPTSTLTTAPPLTFNIGPSGASSSLTVSPASVAPGVAKITLALTGNKWNIGTSDEKKKALIDALVAKDHPDQWKKVKNALNASAVTVIDTNTVEITIPTADLSANQTISLKVPYQVLENTNTLSEVIFTIEATTRALISGTVTPQVSQADIVKGGKTIIVTLVNKTWAADIETNPVERKALLDGFDWGTANNTTAKDIVDAWAIVKRTSDEVVTITLPPIPGFRISGTSEVITFDQNGIGLPNVGAFDAFTITPVTNQTATITGTITTANEFDIAHGDNVMIITLKNDIWTTNLTELEIKTLINDELAKVNLVAKDVQRTNGTVLTITLEGSPIFTSTDRDIILDIPAKLLSISNGIKTSAFKIAAVKAELLGGKDLALDKTDIIKGNKVITITLKNATFIDKLVPDDALIDAIFVSNDSGFDPIKTALKNNKKNISISKNKMTIKLPPVPGYNSSATITTALKIPSEINNIKIIDHAKAQDITVDRKVTIGAVAKAELTQQSFSYTAIKGKTFSITLTGTEWDPAIESNPSKMTALLKGFTVTDQKKEWALLSKEISSNKEFKLSDGVNGDKNTVLTITLPEVPGYSIIRKQVVDIKIPKSVLVNYKEDLTVGGQLVIDKISGTPSTESLGKLMQSGLTEYIKQHGLDKIRVTVPEKHVKTIYTNTIGKLESGNTVTTIEVTTSGVNKINLAVATAPTQDQERPLAGGNNTSIFVFENLGKNSDLKVTILNDKSISYDVFIKIANGNKTYNLVPKVNYAGTYSLSKLLLDKKLLTDILKHYSADDLIVSVVSP